MLYKMAVGVFPLVFLGWPAIARIAKSHVQHKGYPDAAMWIAITVNLFLSGEFVYSTVESGNYVCLNSLKQHSPTCPFVSVSVRKADMLLICRSA